MQIEVFQGIRKNDWRWHFRNKGRITADAEAFPTKAHAIRAGKAVVKAVIKRTGEIAPEFQSKKVGETTVIVWT